MMKKEYLEMLFEITVIDKGICLSASEVDAGENLDDQKPPVNPDMPGQPW